MPRATQRAPLRANALALARIPRTCVNPVDFALRRFLGSGSYPACPPLRTPLGVVAPTAYAPEDLLAINAVFLRRDYPLPRGAQVVVELGAGTGISALYFLTRSSAVRCYLFERDPASVERLAATLAAYEDRYELLGAELAGAALAEVLAVEEHVDLLRLGARLGDADELEAIDRELLARVRVVSVPAPARANPLPELFEMSEAGATVRLTSRSWPPAGDQRRGELAAPA